MKQVKRVIFVVSTLSVISTVTATRAKIAFAAVPALHVLPPLLITSNTTVVSAQTANTGRYTYLSDPNQNPTTTSRGQHLEAAVKSGVTPASPVLIRHSAFSRSASRTKLHEKINLAAVVFRAVEHASLCRHPLTIPTASFLKEFIG